MAKFDPFPHLCEFVILRRSDPLDRVYMCSFPSVFSELKWGTPPPHVFGPYANYCKKHREVACLAQRQKSRPSICKHCDQRYKTRQWLSQHMKTKHPGLEK